jgi:nucleoside-diphosphate-sugar epimerase
LVAGATGFVGQALLAALGPEVERIGVARRAPTGASADGVQWRAADLFNLKEAERALQGVDVAVYLVHSMLPQARLTQARFEDLDLICADNFARACAAQGVRRVVYLGGLLPRGSAPLSRHLASRLEVEGALAAHGRQSGTQFVGVLRLQRQAGQPQHQAGAWRAAPAHDRY